ncbi:hypothetical protein CBO05C_2221 [Clostridium botulinum B str. Osaka05]|uniref:Uncharacterized protein n=1 Tax=Clostridium botulinum B str. Osaka05 TaxID=1407017 RepID=A0A0S6U2J2_CLOBO|nr:hypothetical protein CBO05C_2221 [Clostridium botulinum B str. Osaka05]
MFNFEDKIVKKHPINKTIITPVTIAIFCLDLILPLIISQPFPYYNI